MILLCHTLDRKIKQVLMSNAQNQSKDRLKVNLKVKAKSITAIKVVADL